MGILVIPDEVADADGPSGSGKCGNQNFRYVNAPSLMQRAVAKCLDAQADVPYYDRNREALYTGLKNLGFSCIKPEEHFTCL